MKGNTLVNNLYTALADIKKIIKVIKSEIMDD